MVIIMPSQVHEELIEMFRERPLFAADLLSGPLRIPVPRFDRAHLASSELNDVSPTEYRADAVVTLHRDDKPVLGVVVEVQRRPEEGKRHAWPVYVTTLRARLRCPVVLLAVSPRQSVADWCGERIEIGPPGSVLTPVAFGPKQVPIITDAGAARDNPELAILSAAAHGAGPDGINVFGAMIAGLDTIDQEHADRYVNLVHGLLPAAAKTILEGIMTTLEHEKGSATADRWVSRFEVRGEVKGEANAVLQVLEARGIDVSDEVRAVITGSTDLEQIKTWIRQAATADKIEDLELPDPADG